MLLDSNVLIYAAEPGYEAARRFIAAHEVYVSAASKIEVLGYHKLSAENRKKLELLFEVASCLPITDEIVETAVLLRRQRKMSLGDAIIAATAVVHGMPLATVNTVDFQWIETITVINPLA